MDDRQPPQYRGRRVTVMGLGRFGGGLGAVRFLVERGARVTVTDCAGADQLAESLAELERLPISALHVGGHREEDFAGADLVVVNPAVPRDNRFLDLARRSGVPLTSEMNLFWQHQRGRIVGVTGSNGKSTTTALIHSILTAAGVRARLGGNIGRSLLPEVDEIGEKDWSVLELSSFQLADLDRVKASPDVAVVTNFSPNHLDWHGTLDEYRRAKQTIVRWQSSDGTAVLNADDADVSRWQTGARRYLFGMAPRAEAGCFAVDHRRALFRRDGGQARELPIRDWLTLPGKHNLQNAMAAVCATLAMLLEVTAEAVEQGLRSFCGLPHRLQFVAEVAGRRFYNDSLATTPESTIVALEAFDRPVVLLAGGYDKRVDLSAMAGVIARRCKAVVLMGQTAGVLAALIERRSAATSPAPVVAESFREACENAVAVSAPGDVLLLSPGCASYDWFRNFADRGDQFVQFVHSLARAAAA